MTHLILIVGVSFMLMRNAVDVHKKSLSEQKSY